jgi:hypothetical protein
MMKFSHFLKHASLLAVLLALVLGVFPAAKADAYSSQIYDAQRIAVKFSIPVGPLDGLNGPNTAQGYCGFRWLAGLPVSRDALDQATYAKMKEYDASYADLHATPKKYLSNGQRTYVWVEQTCQLMFYVNDGTIWAVFPVSTGRPATPTPNGYYSMGETVRGWTCSTIYTETCRRQSNGEFANFTAADGTIRNYGNMYNKRQFKAGGFYVHGSNTVPTMPDSGGCVRVAVPNSDWLYHNVPAGVPLVIAGQFNPSATGTRTVTYNTGRTTIK